MVFYRIETGEGGFVCRVCALRQSGVFPRVSDTFAAAARHLNLCRSAARHASIEGIAILDGVRHAVVMRDGIMILAIDTAFDGATLSAPLSA